MQEETSEQPNILSLHIIQTGRYCRTSEQKTMPVAQQLKYGLRNDEKTQYMIDAKLLDKAAYSKFDWHLALRQI